MATITPPRRGEFLTADGQPTHRFITWIESLTAQTNTSTTEIISAAIEEKYPWPTNQPFDEIKEFEYPTIPAEVKQFNAVTITGSYTAVDHDFINAKENALIVFPQYPDENSVIIVRNGDGSNITLSGNGKNINGSSTGLIRRKETSIEFYYFLDSDEWFAK